MLTSSRILSHRRRGHERRRVPSRGRGGRALHTVCHTQRCNALSVFVTFAARQRHRHWSQVLGI